MVDSAVRLFQQQGYRATSWRTLVRASGTPWGSVQHHFPGGKEELGVATVTRAGVIVAELLQAVLASAGDPAAGVRDWFAAGAAALTASEFTEGCPVAPVALEMAHESPALAAACATALGSWVDAVADALRGAGIAETTAESLAVAVVSGYEGALILARAQRSTEPLERVGETLAAMMTTLQDAREI